MRTDLAAAVDADGMLNVFGVNEKEDTPCGMVRTGQRMTFKVAPEGDGRVLWTLGALPGVKTWRARGAHGDLADIPRTFEALQDLLLTGDTNAPEVSDTFRVGEPVEPRDVDMPLLLYPTDGDLVRAAMGGTSATRECVLAVTVVHGNLGLERRVDGPCVVLTGHVRGPRLQGPEAALDVVLQGTLSARLRAGRYPQVAADVLVLPTEGAARQYWPLVVVVGLGLLGRLSRPRVSSAMEQALLEIQQPPHACSLPAGGVTLACSALGLTEGGLTVEESVSAILEAVVRANRAAMQGSGNPLITRLRLVFPYGVQAATALRSARSWADAPGVALEEGERFDVGPWVEPQARDGDPSPSERPVRIREASRFRTISIRGCRETGGPLASLEYGIPTDRSAGRRLTWPVTWPTVRQLQDRLASRSILADDLVRSLRDHLVPPEVLQAVQSGVDVQFLLDEETAASPWEVILAAGLSEGPLQPSRVSLLRQLLGGDADAPPPLPVEAGTALVVCSPGQGDRFLPAAVEEARQVAEALRGPYAVTEVRDDADATRGFLTRTWEVVHLVGHGLFTPGDAGRTGLLVAPGDVLGQHDLRGFLRTPPALVFVNCCHTGRLLRTPTVADPSGLASNLAAFLVRAGVAAVVVTGWAVHDRAAADFATSLYHQLLGGARLRDAVARARLAARKASPGTPTWAAYQVYGDPNFFLPAPLHEAGSLVGELHNALEHHDFVSPRETEDFLGQVYTCLQLAPGRTATDPDFEELVRRTEEMYRHLDRPLRSARGQEVLDRIRRAIEPGPEASSPPPARGASERDHLAARAQDTLDAFIAAPGADPAAIAPVVRAWGAALDGGAEPAWIRRQTTVLKRSLDQLRPSRTTPPGAAEAGRALATALSEALPSALNDPNLGRFGWSATCGDFSARARWGSATGRTSPFGARWRWVSLDVTSKARARAPWPVRVHLHPGHRTPVLHQTFTVGERALHVEFPAATGFTVGVEVLDPTDGKAVLARLEVDLATCPELEGRRRAPAGPPDAPPGAP